MKRTVAVVTESGRVSTSAFVNHEHALKNLDPFFLCTVRTAVVDYFKSHPQFCARTPEETLNEIGNIAGRPDTHYASVRFRYHEALAKLREISELVQEQFGGAQRPQDPDKFRQGLTLSRTFDKSHVRGYYLSDRQEV